MSELSFKSIVKELNPSNDKWTPIEINTYANSLKIEGDKKFCYALSRDIGYSLQYIEFIQKQLNELRLTDPIIKLLYKSYIITSIGIIESLFTYILKKEWFITTR
jgi:hypothetical protein